MYVAKGSEYLPEITIDTLYSAYKNESDGKSKIRLQCAILRKKGKSQPNIAEITGLPQTTVSGILNRFVSRGIKASKAIPQNGQPKRLTSKQEKNLKTILSKSPEKVGIPFTIWTTKVVQYLLRKKFGVRYVIRHVNRLLKKLGFTMQKARPQHRLANQELQAKHKKKFDEEFATLGPVDMRSYFWTKVHSASNHM